MPPPRYRPDIDGLRAVAVVAVVLTHVGIAGFGGGFIGVDIFFVISGYLIHRDLVTRSRTGRLSLLGFYGRRMRRTLPALYLVAAATLVGATVVMMPGDLDALARSLVATILLIPNIFFLTDSGYFDTAAAAKPLLHAWSLGVEAQFYLLAPLLLIALRGLAPVRRRLVLSALFVVSLGGTIALWRLTPAAAFYLMPARIFEFLVGAMLVEGLVPPVRRRWVAETSTLLALGTIATSIVLFGETVPHPGLATLFPCIAVGTIIHVGATHQTLAGRLLGLKPITFVGLVSYSLYLWHWPMLALARYADLSQTPAALTAGAMLLLALSVVSWRFVETPFRRLGSSWCARAPTLLPAGFMALLAACALVTTLHGLPGRFPPDVTSVASFSAYGDLKPFREGRCFVTSKDRPEDYDRATCLRIAPDRENVLLLGDSHAAQLWTGLRDVWPNVNFLQATASGCKPLIGTTGASRCTTLIRDMFQRFIPQHHLDGIVIAGLWNSEDVAPLITTIATLWPSVDRVVVFGPLPRYDAPAARLIAQAILRGNPEQVSKHLMPEVPRLDLEMRRELAPIATYVSPYEIICPKDRCRLLAAPGVPMQFDYHHLTPLGADLLMTMVREHGVSIVDGSRIDDTFATRSR